MLIKFVHFKMGIWKEVVISVTVFIYVICESENVDGIYVY